MYQDLVGRFNSGRHTKLKWARFKAIIDCLSSEEICQCIYDMLPNEYNRLLLDTFAQKLKDDITNNGWQPCHAILSQQLLEKFKAHESKQRRATILGGLASLEATPQILRNEILQSLLSSNHENIRRCAYQALAETDTQDFIDEIEQAWLSYKDIPCARLIVKRLPKAFQEKHYDDLWALQDERTTIHLLRNVDLTPDRLATVKAADGITYAYICTKRGIIFTSEEASSLWNQYAEHERAGLLIWCFGQMQLKDVLTELQLHRTRHPTGPPKPLVLHGG